MIAEIRCSYCDILMGYKDVEVPKGMPAITHGICQDCLGKALADLKASREQP